MIQQQYLQHHQIHATHVQAYARLTTQTGREEDASVMLTVKPMETAVVFHCFKDQMLALSNPLILISKDLDLSAVACTWTAA